MVYYSTLNGSVISALGHSNSPTATNSKRSFKKVINFLSVDKTTAGGDGIFAFRSAYWVVCKNDGFFKSQKSIS